MRFLGSKYARNAFAARASPRTPLGKLTTFPTPDHLAGFKGAYTCKGRGGEKREGAQGGGREGEERGGKRREGKGREGGLSLTPLFFTLRRPCIQ